MPYASDKQRRLMQAVAHDAAFAKKVGIPQSVGQKFEAHKAEGGQANNLLPYISQGAALSGMLPLPGRIGTPGNTQQFTEGALSQLYGLDEKGEPAFLGGDSWKHWPGIVDETLSIPTLLPDRWTPGFAKRAAQRMEDLHAKMYRDMGIKPPTDLVGNLYNAAGTMAAQIPTGGAKAVEGAIAKPGLWRSAGRSVAKLGEWFTPTVEAKPSNYLIGTLTGGGLNTLDATPPAGKEPGVNNKYCDGGMATLRSKYASGGQAPAPRDAIESIRQAVAAIQTGDHDAAYSALSPHSDNPEIAEVLKSLRSAVAAKN